MNLDAIASGAEAPPPRRVNLGASELLILAVTDTIIGACNMGAGVLDRFGMQEPAAIIHHCGEAIQSYGKCVIDQAAHPPLVEVPRMHVEGMPDVPEAGQALGFRAERVKKALSLLHRAAQALRGEG